MEPSTSAAPAKPARNKERPALVALRAVATAHAIAIFGQPVFAGVLLSGDYDMLHVHAVGADVVYYLCMAQLAAAIFLWVRGGPRWPSAVTGLILLGETGQYFAGLFGALDVHFPLGVALIALTTTALVALWRPSALGVAR
ncbi:hypothetical protein LZ318_12120 [Saccharopolyspora indica]|uniref:hypothetical protein n=1 Tax=Saccharopolyspora indica TaxID=1229659 RepID=UPI0022EB5911|nr:hypothetical protein [Saccharopolyspora indica]MDA3643745.1 hypothetical protein [Saccharopolyspora indica]